MVLQPLCCPFPSSTMISSCLPFALIVDSTTMLSKSSSSIVLGYIFAVERTLFHCDYIQSNSCSYIVCWLECQQTTIRMVINCYAAAHLCVTFRSKQPTTDVTFPPDSGHDTLFIYSRFGNMTCRRQIFNNPTGRDRPARHICPCRFV